MTICLIAANVRAEPMLAGGWVSTARADSQAAANPDPRSKRSEGDRRRPCVSLFGRSVSNRAMEGRTEGVGGLDGGEMEGGLRMTDGPA